MRGRSTLPITSKLVLGAFFLDYADIILPLPLDGVFTYSVPAPLQKRVVQGGRVLVPFGRNKMYVGVVSRLHDTKPEGYSVKPVAQAMDEAPILIPQQLALWQWISDYYLSPVGEVYKAALPSGLKAEDGYKPKTETYIRLTRQFRSEQSLHVALSLLTRSVKQQEALTEYLAMSHWDTVEGDMCREAPVEITRDELMNQSYATAATLNQLVKRGILETYEVEVGRLNHGGEPHPENVKPLNEAQQTAYNAVLFSFLKKNVTLLHGVTSSGKT